MTVLYPYTFGFTPQKSLFQWGTIKHTTHNADEHRSLLSVITVILLLDWVTLLLTILNYTLK